MSAETSRAAPGPSPDLAAALVQHPMHDPARTIALFAPGGYDPDPQRLVAARSYFETRGYLVNDRLAIGHHHQRFSDTDAERLRWIDVVCRDPDPGIAMAVRGGYGATRLLPDIDFAAMATAVRRGKRFVGHSDFTAIELALLAETGAVSLAGPMASFGFGRDDVDPFTESSFWTAIDESRVEADFATPFAGAARACGVLWGGNLAMLTSLVGTRWMPAMTGGILFVEDVNEQPYRVERMLMQLQQAGILECQSLVLCGDFLDHRVTPYDDGYDIAAAIARVQETTSVPIVAGLPFGHGPRTLTLAIGAAAEVSVAQGICRLNQRWTI